MPIKINKNLGGSGSMFRNTNDVGVGEFEIGVDKFVIEQLFGIENQALSARVRLPHLVAIYRFTELPFLLLSHSEAQPGRILRATGCDASTL